jgi:hypothetical protein
MRKMLLVICVVALAGCIASAQLVSPTTYNFTYSGYCDGAHLVLQKLTSSGVGSVKIFIGGFHDGADVCGFSNAAVVGMKAGINHLVPPRSITNTTGPVFITADADKDAQCLCDSGQQWSFVYDYINHFSSIYENFLGFDGDYYCCSQTLLNGLPAKGNAASRGPAGGTFQAVRKHD